LNAGPLPPAIANLRTDVARPGERAATTHEILINVTPQETRVAMLEQAVVQ